jgi:hypothetical protein
MGVSLRNLMTRMGHDNERAALIYQHASSQAGTAKCGGNYAAAFVAQAQAVREGCR